MKKRMKLTAMLASAALFFGSSLTGNAEVLPFRIFGSMNDDSIHQMQVLDAKDWIKYKPEGGVFRKVKENTSYYVLTYHLDDLERSHPQYYIWYDPMYLAVPQQDMLQYVLRTDTNLAAAHQQAEEIVQKYFPGQKLDPSYYPNNAFRRIIVSDKALRTAERADGLMHELAEAGLISEFYTWGETLQYLDFDHGFLTAYNAHDIANDRKLYDWAAIEAWVNENHPECELVCIMDKDSELGKKLTISFWTTMFWDDTFYAVIPPEETSFADHFALAMELYEQFGLQPCARLSSLEHELYYMVGKNGLAVAGDANLDCSVDVADAVLVARFAARRKISRAVFFSLSACYFVCFML